MTKLLAFPFGVGTQLHQSLFIKRTIIYETIINIVAVCSIKTQRFVIPAEAGISGIDWSKCQIRDPDFRRDDPFKVVLRSNKPL